MRNLDHSPAEHQQLLFSAACDDRLAGLSSYVGITESPQAAPLHVDVYDLAESFAELADKYHLDPEDLTYIINYHNGMPEGWPFTEDRMRLQ
ncbi:MAG TPA: hypothetical protein VFI84_02115 [Candidatus Saccharimonadales bacterium]|nr:hypothetical protein [Candidatus Saccharimonadales bacterium]